MFDGNNFQVKKPPFHGIMVNVPRKEIVNSAGVWFIDFYVQVLFFTDGNNIHVPDSCIPNVW